MTTVWHAYLAPELIAEAAARPDEFGAGWTRSRSGVTMFVDIAGFTPLSEALGRTGPAGTEELTGLLNAYFDPTIACIERFGGSVLAFAGDAMNVLFPSTGDLATVAHRALTCAVLLRQQLPRYAALQTSVGAFALHSRIGMAVGDVITTIVGTRVRTECVTGGHPINVSARAESLAAPGEIVVHDDLVALVPAVLPGAPRDGFHVIEGLATHAHEPPAPSPVHLTDDLIERICAFLHPAVAKRARAGRAEFIDEHRRVTTMFARFRDLDFAEPSTPSALQSYLAHVFDLVDQYDGHLRQVELGDKGSKFIAVFGAPVTRGDDQARALACALRVRDLDPSTTSVGMTTGLVYCGHLGCERRHEYAIVGDAVNLAARLMQAAAPGQVLADAPTVGSAGRRFVFAAAQRLVVKGKSVPVDASPLEGLHDVEAPRWTDPDAVPMVGRSDELARAVSQLDLAGRGSGRVLLIWGEPGIGKSRLGLAVAREASARDLDVHWAVFDRYGPRSSYRGWRGLWRSLLQVGSVDGDELIRALRSRLADIEPDLADRVPLLDVVFGVPIPDNDLTSSLDPRLRSQLLQDVLLRCLQHASQSAPVLLVVEDAHWMDEASLGLLEHLARNAAMHAVCLVVLSRPDGTDTAAALARLHAFAHAESLRLEELSEVDASVLVQARAREALGEAASAALVASVRSRAAGNPLFIEELLDYVAAHRGAAVDGAAPTVDLPDSLTSLVLARIDQLREDEQTTLKLASIVGRQIDASWLSGSFPDACPPAQIHGRLAALCRADLVLASGEGSYGYTFKHATIQEVAYNSLSIHHRASLHEAVGRHLERVGRSDGSDVDLLAYHYGRSRNVLKKRTYFERAGDRAKDAYANGAAIDYYERLLALPSKADPSSVQVKLGQVRELVGDWDEAENLYRSCADAASAPVRATALAALGYLLSYRGAAREALEWLERARSEAELVRDPATLSWALDRLVRAHWLRSEYDVALAHARRQAELAEASGEQQQVAAALANLGGIKWDQGDLDHAVSHLRRAHDLAEDSGDLRLVVHTANDLVGVHVQQGHHLDAIARLDEAATVARRIGYQHAAGVVTGNEAELRLHRGDDAGALGLAWSALRTLTVLGDSLGVLEQLGRIAQAFAGLGRDDDAEALFRRCLEMGRAGDRPLFLCEHLHAYARWLADRGRYDEAERLNDEAIRLATSLNDVVVRLRALLLRLRVGHESGRVITDVALAQLHDLLDHWHADEEQAAIHYHIWRVDPRHDASRRRAAELYAALHSAAPVAEHERRYEALTGDMLAVDDALPLSTAPPPRDATEVLRHIDALNGRAAAAGVH